MPAATQQKKKPAPKDTSKYNSVLEGGGYPAVVKYSGTKRVHTVAKSDLPAGAIVCNERAAALVISTVNLSKYCHYCVEPLNHAELVGTKVTCGQCGHTSYCSKKCQDKNTELHDLVCPLQSDLAKIAQDNTLNVDLLRIILTLIARRSLEEKKERLTKKGATFKKTNAEEDGPEVSPFFCVTDLAVHRDAFDKAWLKAITGAAKAMQEILPENMKTSPSDIIDYACRINSNAHSLSDDDGQNADTAFGLFPMGSLLFRHSCDPNCHFIGDRGTLTYRTLRPIKEGEELYVCHIEPFHSRAQRRQELLKTKHFKCDCSRCRVPLAKSVDRYLDGVLCEKCGKGVYLNTQKGSEEQEENGEEKEATATCDECSHTVPTGPLIELQMALQGNFAEITQKLYVTRQFPACAANIPRFIAHFAPKFHRYNAVLQAARGYLFVAYSVLKSFDRQLVALVKEMMCIYTGAGIMVPVRQEYVEFYIAAGDAMLRLAIEAEAKSGSRPEKDANKGGKGKVMGEVLGKRYRADAVEWWTKAVEVGKVANGEGHKKVKEAKSKIQGLRK